LYFILFYFILFYFILFYFILFYFILFYFILFIYLFILNRNSSTPPPLLNTQKRDATGIEWNSKVAPGMEVAFLVKFAPDSMRDYQCDLVCMTEREKFAIPLVAIGSRGMVFKIKNYKIQKEGRGRT